MNMRNNVFKNVAMLYGLTAAKLIFPLLTLPYLTRVLTLEEYGIVAYVKAVMGYMQLFVDFGFMLSGTKDIVAVRKDKAALSSVTSDILFARIMLSALAFVVLVFLTFGIPILRSNQLFTLLSFGTIFLSVFLFDYLFRGLEKMEIITQRFVVMKAISTLLTFVFVHSGKDLLWIPALDMLGSFAAVILVLVQMRKFGVKILCPVYSNCLRKIYESAAYFISNAATTLYVALTTIMIGAFLPAADVAYWSVSVQIVAAIQMLYAPINDGIYPDMVRTRNMKLVKNIVKLFVPLISLGCIALFVLSKYVLGIIGGAKYIPAYWLLRLLIPLVFISFPAILFGWPVLGAIDKPKQVMNTTISAGVFHLAGFAALLLLGQFTLFNIALLRNVTEFVLFATRFGYYLKYKNEFAE